MPFTVTRLEAVPRPTRQKKSKVEDTEEWLQFLAKMFEDFLYAAAKRATRKDYWTNIRCSRKEVHPRFAFTV